MKKLLSLVVLLLSPSLFAQDPPDGYPVVAGVVRKVDMAASRISLKHEEIPNLEMPGMTMSFAVQIPADLEGLVAGDHVNFVADEVEGEITVLWIEKVEPPTLGETQIFCEGLAPTTPRTRIELEIRPKRFSTIRYEQVEGAFPGTAHVNSIGRLELHQRGKFHFYRTNIGPQKTILQFQMTGTEITEACFSHFNSGMDQTPVTCRFETTDTE